MNLRAHIDELKAQVGLLLAEYPELADDEQLRLDTLDGETDINWLASMLVDAALNAGTMADAIKIRVSDLSDRKKRFENKEQSLRNLIKTLMDAAQLPKLQLTDATLSIRSLSPSPIVTDATLLPDDCVRLERKPDMAAIKAAMEARKELPGIVMSNGGTSLTIRVK